VVVVMVMVMVVVGTMTMRAGGCAQKKGQSI
jgi:hypothetical protein